MFLNMLNETEGKNFLELAKIAMAADGVIKPSEEAIFETFRMELNLKDYDVKNIPEEKLITAFKASTKKVRKAVVIELVGVLYADSEVDASEKAWIEKLGKEWGFRESEMSRMIRWTQDFNDLVMEGYNYITKA